MTNEKTYLVIFFLLTLSSRVHSYNQVRIDKFRWKTAETPNLFVYYYPPQEEKFSIEPVIKQLEFTHREISKILNVEFARKTPVFIFYNHDHFQQNRIVPAQPGVEGFSEAFKNRLVIPVRYSRYDMNHLIAHEYVHIAQFEILYGGFWKSSRLIKGLSGLQPLWIMEGMAESISHRILNRKWSSYDRMILRDAVLYDNLYRIRDLQNFSALYRDVYLGYKESHSAMDYLIEKEGEEINFKLLKAMRNNMDPIKAFETAAEKFASLNDFDLKWRKDLKSRVNSFVQGKDKIQDVSEILVSDRYNSLNPVPADNKGSFFYVSDRWLTDQIYLYTPEKETKILPNFFGSNVKRLITGRKFDRIIDYNPGKNLLIFAAEKKHRNYLFIYNTVTTKLKKIKIHLNELISPSISNDGNRIVFTALKDGARNIYLYEIDSGNIVKITDDEFMDYAPVFSPDGNTILVSTERDLNTDLRIIDIDTGKSTWLTQTPYNEIQPTYGHDRTIYYSADKNSVFNIYKYEVNNSTSKPVTNIRGGTFYPEVDEDGKILCSCYFNKSFKIIELKDTDKGFQIKATRSYINEPSPEVSTSAITIGRFKKRFSTDFFFPSFLYSTETGFIGAGYYRISDILGNHNIDFYGWGWPGAYEVSTQYLVKKWRPDIFLTLRSAGKRYLEEDDEEYSQNYHSSSLGYTYPVDSFISISNWITAASIDKENLTSSEKTHETETGAGIGITRSTALLEPFHVLRGSVFSVYGYWAGPLEKFGISYNRYDCSLRKYAPFSHRLTLANRLYLARTEGEDADDLKLGTGTGWFFNTSPYNLRGYTGSSFTGRNLTSLNSELRFMLFPKINWHIYFIWPDINIYSLSIKVFSDAGTCWDEVFPSAMDKWGTSWGFGFKLNIYLMQLAPIFINAEFARPYNEMKWKYYWTLSSGYITW